jgi:hypothetical protein
MVEKWRLIYQIRQKPGWYLSHLVSHLIQEKLNSPAKALCFGVGFRYWSILYPSP